MSFVGDIHGGTDNVFKSLLDYSFSIFDDQDMEKEKLCSPTDSQSDGGGVVSDGGVSGAATGPGAVSSASLTPAIWDKTIPYDGETFHLEYMDLDEFLLENGIPVGLEEELHRSLLQEKAKAAAGPPHPTDKATVTSATVAEATPPLEVAVESEAEEDGEEVSTNSEGATVEVKEEAKAAVERATPPPVNPEEIEVDVNFQPDPTDLVLSSVPGGELFNPRKHRFSEEELKPQPMIKKAKKVFVPSEQKDDKYWCRRKKNNVAAKRSRDARRLKENQITVRAAFLERENAALRQEVAELRKDCGSCKKVMSRYEAKYGRL